MKTIYTLAPEIEAIAKPLIRDFHPHLRDCRIVYCFTNRTPVKGGKEVWATIRRISSLPAFLAGENDPDGPGAFFCIVVSKQVWDCLGVHKRRALIDHELYHAWKEYDDKGNETLSLVGHDCEDFIAIIQRYGAWKQDIEQFSRAFAQAPSLLDTVDDETESD